MHFRTLRFPALLAVLAAAALLAQTYNANLYSGMRWRQIGPFRAGRISAVAGIAGDPANYYIGNPGGGVWKTTDGGTVWKPIFDEQHMDSIGSIAVAPSNPNIVYVGTGDVSNVGGSVNQGNGMWKSLDAGAHWQHIGLEDSRHIVALVVDPKNPDIVLAAALGHTFSRNEERGVFRTTDGGRSWNKVLYKSDDLGAVNLVADPDNPQTLFAALMLHYSAPGGRGGGAAAPPADAAGAGIYKSTDEGATWTAVTGHGLPESGLGRIGLAVAAHTHGERVFAIVQGGLYRSDDGGANWHRNTTDPRVTGSGYFSQVYVSPDNPDIVYVVQTSLYRSTDGGQNFVAYKGAPGGDDYHVLWIDPTNGKRILAGVDQGPTISLDGGQSWDLNWYNLPNGQFYHIATDNRFPYWVYGTQQDSGSAGTSTRGAFGQITFMEWLPSVGAYEFGYVHPDPLDPTIILASGAGTSINRYDLTIRQTLNVSPPRSGNYRFSGGPQAFSPVDGHIFYLGAQYVLETRDRGLTWKPVSPDLTQVPGEPAPETPPPGGRGGGRGNAISALSPSPLRAGAMWAGTSNAQIQMTADGASWHNVTPPNLPANTAVEQIEASPHNIDTAFFVMEHHTANDFAPYIFRTRDGGKTWNRVVTGIPEGELVRVVREDSVRAGLLYAGTEHGVCVSFDSGDHWQSLQLNLPTASVRDLVVHGDDLVAGTYGRAFWVLDDLTPLRQLSAQVADSDAWLFRPQTAIRVRWHTGYDTPFPPELPAGANPPDGAILDYYLKSAAGGGLTIGIYEAAGALVRELTSVPPPAEPEPQLNIPNYWLAHPQPLPTTAGMNRVAWDLRDAPPPAFSHQYPISALYGQTPAEPRGPLVTPGDYEVRLTVGGRTYRQPLHVILDPRVKASSQEIAEQRDLGLRIAAGMTASYQANQQVADLRAALAALQAPVPDAATALATKAATFGGAPAGRGGRGGGGGGFGGRGGAGATVNFTALNGQFGSLMNTVEEADAAPTGAMRENFQDSCQQLAQALRQWEDLKRADLAALNGALGSRQIVVPPAALAGPPCGQ